MKRLKTIPILLIDKEGNTVELQLNRYQYMNLAIPKNDVKKNPKKSDLNKTVTDFINKHKGDV